MTYFDNIGKYISKSYRVLSQKYIQPDIVTATLHIRFGEQHCKKNEKLKPGNCRQLTADEKCALIEEEIDRSNQNFRKYRLEFIAKMLNIVESESSDVEKKKCKSHLLKENSQMRHVKSLKSKKLKPNTEDLQLL